MLKGKKIILGITGSIAAYKACYIIRGLIKQGAEVQVVITPAGKEFITPITLSALTSKPVISEFFAQRDGTWNSHVDLGLWADAMLIAPATASTIGKMGFALAEECARRGAEVTLIAGPVQLEAKHSRIHRIDVESAEEMHVASQACFSDADAAILCAAVADYRPETVADKKIKREKEGELTLHLQATKDIAAGLGAVKREGQLLVGFALETNNEQQNAEGKLERKNFDFIVLNSLNDVGAGFRHDTNKISIIDRKGRTDYPLKSKTEVAQDIIDRLSDELKLSTLNS